MVGWPVHCEILRHSVKTEYAFCCCPLLSSVFPKLNEISIAGTTTDSIPAA